MVFLQRYNIEWPKPAKEQRLKQHYVTLCRKIVDFLSLVQSVPSLHHLQPLIVFQDCDGWCQSKLISDKFTNQNRIPNCVFVVGHLPRALVFDDLGMGLNNQLSPELLYNATSAKMIF